MALLLSFIWPAQVNIERHRLHHWQQQEGRLVDYQVVSSVPTYEYNKPTILNLVEFDSELGFGFQEKNQCLRSCEN
jgi:hypothetical protein